MADKCKHSCLPNLNRISGVSGGSIIAGMMAMNWNKLNFKNEVAEDIPLAIQLCRTLWMKFPKNHYDLSLTRPIFQSNAL